MARCEGKTKQGTRCKNQALGSEHYCRMHQQHDVASTSNATPDSGNEKWKADQTTVTAIGGATLGAVVGGPLGALVGGAVGAFMGNYQGWESFFKSDKSDDNG